MKIASCLQFSSCMCPHIGTKPLIVYAKGFCIYLLSSSKQLYEKSAEIDKLLITNNSGYVIA